MALAVGAGGDGGTGVLVGEWVGVATAGVNVAERDEAGVVGVTSGMNLPGWHAGAKSKKMMISPEDTAATVRFAGKPDGVRADVMVLLRILRLTAKECAAERSVTEM